MEQVSKIESALETLLNFFWIYGRTYFLMLISPYKFKKLVIRRDVNYKIISPLAFFATSSFIFSVIQTFLLIDMKEIYSYIFTNRILTISIKDFLLHISKNLTEESFSIWGFITIILPVAIISLVFINSCIRFIKEDKKRKKRVYDVLLYLVSFQCFSFTISILIFLSLFIIINSPFSEIPSIIAFIFFFYTLIVYPFFVIAINFINFKRIWNVQNLRYLVLSIFSMSLIFILLEIIEIKESFYSYINKKEKVYPIVKLVAQDGRNSLIKVDKKNKKMKGDMIVYNPFKEQLFLIKNKLGFIESSNSNDFKVALKIVNKNESPIIVIDSKDIVWIKFSANLNENQYNYLEEQLKRTKENYYTPHNINITFNKINGYKKEVKKSQYFNLLIE